MRTSLLKLTQSELLLRSPEGDRLAGRVARRHLDVDASLREDLVDAVALGSDDVAVLRLFNLDGHVRDPLFLQRECGGIETLRDTNRNRKCETATWPAERLN